MSKFCVKCGAEMPEESKFCPKCGNEVGNYNSSAGKKKILPFIIGGGIVVALIILVVILVITLGGGSSESSTSGNSSKSDTNKNSSGSSKNDNNLGSDIDENSPESVALEFCNAGYEGDMDKFIELMYPGEYETLPADDKEDIKIAFKEYAKTSKYICEYASKEKVTGDFLDGYKDGLKEYYGVDISDASAVYTVRLNVRAKDDDSDLSIEDYYVVKSGSKYYVDWYGTVYLIYRVEPKIVEPSN